MINRENNAICIVLGTVYSDNYAEIGTGKSGFEIVPSCFRFVAFVVENNIIEWHKGNGAKTGLHWRGC